MSSRSPTPTSPAMDFIELLSEGHEQDNVKTHDNNKSSTLGLDVPMPVTSSISSSPTPAQAYLKAYPTAHITLPNILPRTPPPAQLARSNIPRSLNLHNSNFRSSSGDPRPPGPSAKDFTTWRSPMTPGSSYTSSTGSTPSTATLNTPYTAPGGVSPYKLYADQSRNFYLEPVPEPASPSPGAEQFTIPSQLDQFQLGCAPEFDVDEEYPVDPSPFQAPRSTLGVGYFSAEGSPVSIDLDDLYAAHADVPLSPEESVSFLAMSDTSPEDTKLVLPADDVVSEEDLRPAKKVKRTPQRRIKRGTVRKSASKKAGGGKKAAKPLIVKEEVREPDDIATAMPSPTSSLSLASLSLHATPEPTCSAPPTPTAAPPVTLPTLSRTPTPTRPTLTPPSPLDSPLRSIDDEDYLPPLLPSNLRPLKTYKAKKKGNRNGERRQTQNRCAQRKYRTKIKSLNELVSHFAIQATALVRREADGEIGVRSGWDMLRKGAYRLADDYKRACPTKAQAFEAAVNKAIKDAA